MKNFFKVYIFNLEASIFKPNTIIRFSNHAAFHFHLLMMRSSRSSPKKMGNGKEGREERGERTYLFYYLYPVIKLRELCNHPKIVGINFKNVKIFNHPIIACALFHGCQNSVVWSSLFSRCQHSFPSSPHVTASLPSSPSFILMTI